MACCDPLPKLTSGVRLAVLAQLLSSLEEVDQALAKMKAAQQKFREYNQEQVDNIFEESAQKVRIVVLLFHSILVH